MKVLLFASLLIGSTTCVSSEDGDISRSTNSTPTDTMEIVESLYDSSISCLKVKLSEDLKIRLSKNKNEDCILKVLEDNKVADLFVKGLAFNILTEGEEFDGIADKSNEKFVEYSESLCRYENATDERVLEKLKETRNCIASNQNSIKALDLSIGELHKSIVASGGRFEEQVTGFMMANRQRVDLLLAVQDCLSSDRLFLEFDKLFSNFWDESDQNVDDVQRCITKHYAEMKIVNLTEYGVDASTLNTSDCQSILDDLENMTQSFDITQKFSAEYFFGLEHENIQLCAAQELSGLNYLQTMMKIQVVSTLKPSDDQILKLRVDFVKIMLAIANAHFRCSQLFL